MTTQQLVLNTNGRGTDAASLGERVQAAVAAVKVKPVVTFQQADVDLGDGVVLKMHQRVVDGEAKPSFKTTAPLLKADVLAYAEKHGVSRKQAERTLKAERNAAAAGTINALLGVQKMMRNDKNCVAVGTLSNAKGNLRIGVTASLLSKENQAKKDARDFASHAADCIRNGSARKAKDGIVIPFLK